MKVKGRLAKGWSWLRKNSASAGLPCQVPPNICSISAVFQEPDPDGVIALVPSLAERNCYHYKLLYGLFVVAIVTGFFSVLGMWS